MRSADERRLSRRAALLGGTALATAALPLGRAVALDTAASPGDAFRLLVFSRTAGYRHASIPAGVKAVRALGAANGFAVDATEDPAVFDVATLKQYAAVMFLNTTGDVLSSAAQRTAFEAYVRGGGGYVGVHSAADTEHDWPFYGKVVGSYFSSHPIQQIAFFDKEGGDHAATRHLANRFPVFDEHYSFTHNPRPHVRVLLTIDESTYFPNPNTSNLPVNDDGTLNPGWFPGKNGYMGDHPMTWCHDKFRGHCFYTALGHEAHLYDQAWYRQHLLGGILSAARRAN